MADLDPAKDYRFEPAPKPALLTRDLWNAAMASISQRLRAVEEKGDTLDDLVADLSFNGQARIDAAITPLIEQVRRDVAALELAVDTAVSDAANAATAVADEANRRIARVEADLDAIEEAYARIIAGGVEAALVRESDERRFVTTAQREEIGALRTDADALRTDLETAETEAASSVLRARRHAYALQLHLGT